jgi:hypothetical protein
MFHFILDSSVYNDLFPMICVYNMTLNIIYIKFKYVWLSKKVIISHSGVYMKSFILFLFLPLQFILSQIQLDTTEYFPLQSGDHWEYAMFEYPTTYYLFANVTGDTLMPNGKSYKILKENFPGDTYNYYSYYRNEGKLVYRYIGIPDSVHCPEGEQVEYNFAARDSVIWPICDYIFEAGYKSCVNTYIQHEYMTQTDIETKTFYYVAIDNVDTIWSPLSTEIINVSKNIGIESMMGESEHFGLFAAVLNGKTYGNPVGVKDNIAAPPTFSLSQNYPNPFNPSTTINYSLPKAGNVRLTVYNSIGSKVATIVDEYKTAGNYSVKFNGSNLASGIYLYRLESGGYTAAKKFIMMK